LSESYSLSNIVFRIQPDLPKKADIDQKLTSFQRKCNTIRKILTRKDTIQILQKMAVPTLLYASEAWIIEKEDVNRIQASEKKFLRAVKDCTKLDKIKYEDIRKELAIFTIKVIKFESCFVQAAINMCFLT